MIRMTNLQHDGVRRRRHRQRRFELFAADMKACRWGPAIDAASGLVLAPDAYYTGRPR